MDGFQLAQDDRIEYLGATLSGNPHHHVDARVGACRRAFYVLQGAGLCNQGLNPDSIRYLWMAAVRPVLTYGAPCVTLSKSAKDKLDKCQTKLLKSVLGLRSFCRNTPLLQALRIKTVSETICGTQRDIVKSIMRNDSRGLKFYSYLLSIDYTDAHTVFGNVYKNCLDNNISLVNYIYNDSYSSQIKRAMPYCEDGLIDSVKLVLFDEFYDPYLLNLLLSPF